MSPLLTFTVAVCAIALVALIVYGVTQWLGHRHRKFLRAEERARVIENYQDQATVEDLRLTRKRINDALDRREREIREMNDHDQ